MRQPVFFQPTTGWVGDVIPFEEDGRFHLFYLHDVRTTPKPGTPWHVVTTTDLVDFDDRGVSLENGDHADADFNAYTGSVVRDAQGVHHLFYTGQNPASVGADGLPLQLVMHASSTDGMATWARHPEHTFGATAGYETGDWRDPFVFFDAEAGLWRLILAARHEDGPDRRRGVIAQCVSTDLETWEPAEPFWDPRRYIAHECPEVFQWGDWWYLVYSEFSETFTTRYRMARSLAGPWIVPEHDSIDGRAYYAAKSAEREGRRFFFGWIASKEGSADDGAWQWAGTMSVLEARQRTDGTLAFQVPDEVLDSFGEVASLVEPGELPLQLTAPDGYAAHLFTPEPPEQFSARITVDIAADTTEFGVLLRASNDGDESYVIRLEPRRGRMVFDRWPRRRTGSGQWEVSGDVPFAIELERACRIDAGEHILDVVVDASICVVTLDREVVLSTRLYDRPSGRLGVFVGEGAATVTDVVMRLRPEN